MSIAHELHWATASKPKFGKSTEHSGAKKGKGAWDKKKVAKQTSNKGRRAGGKQEIKDQTVGDKSDGPFPGSAPLFKKAAAMHWTTAEPRPCYPTEEPVEDHCNDGIAPPAPGGGDDMGSAPPGGSGDSLYEGAQDLERDARFARDEGKPDKADDILRQADELREQAYKLDGPGVTPETQGPSGGDGTPEGSDEPDAWNWKDSDYELERQEVEKEWEEQDEIRDSGFDGEGGGGEYMGEPDMGDIDYEGEDPGPRPLYPSPDGMGPQGRTPSPDGMGPQGHDGQQTAGPHDARDPGLAPDAPHQFWAQEAPHVQDALNKYLMPQLNSPNPEIAQKAQKILREGPHAE